MKHTYDCKPEHIMQTKIMIETLKQQHETMKLWTDVTDAAKTNPALQLAIDQCLVIYHLTQK